MKLTPLRVASNTSWVEATQQLITAALEKSKNLRRLTILEEPSESNEKFKLMAHVRSR
jgi:hypothetical protein